MFYEPKPFKNEEALSSEHLPETLPHREHQIDRMAKNLEPASKRRKPQNTFIHGPPGIGKTACIKFVFRQFEEYSGIKTIYINTWDYNTSPSILTKLVISLNFPIVRRGISKDEIIERLIEALNKMRGGLIICLDEVDQAIGRDEKILYDLLRLNQYVNNPIGLVMISNYKDIFVNVEPRIKSSLDVEEIEFKPYTLQEMKDILNDRIKLAFHPGTLEEGVVLLCANHAINKGGDVRVGLECLRKAAKVAEDENSSKILVKHVKQILPRITEVKPEIVKEKVVDVEKEIIELLQKKDKFMSTELYEKYLKSYKKISQFAFTRHVKHLRDVGLVKIEESREKTRGRKFFISLSKRNTFK